MSEINRILGESARCTLNHSTRRLGRVIESFSMPQFERKNNGPGAYCSRPVRLATKWLSLLQVTEIRVVRPRASCATWEDGANLPATRLRTDEVEREVGPCDARNGIVRPYGACARIVWQRPALAVRSANLVGDGVGNRAPAQRRRTREEVEHR